VEEIGWRLTRIRRFDKRPIYVPNSVFTNIAVVNASRMTNRRIKCTVGIRYDDIGKLQAIVDDIENMLKNHPEIDPRQTTFVSFVEFGPSACDILVYTFTRTTQWVPFQKIQQDVLLKIAQIIEAHGAQIAYPTRTVHLHTEPAPAEAPG
jgi:MscS family membrane protein